MHQEMDVKPTNPESPPKAELPDWGRNIVNRLGRTIFKPVLKLRPGSGINWRNYGRMLGVMERFKAFSKVDVPRMLGEDLVGLTKERAAKIEASLGLDQWRARCVKVLNRPVAQDGPLESLLEEIGHRQMAYHERLRQIALRKR